MRVSQHTAQAFQSPLAGTGHDFVHGLRDSDLKTTYVTENLSSPPFGMKLRPQRSSRCSNSSVSLVIAQCPSRGERPVGRGLPFGPGDVETRIRSITERPSLFPTSHSRTPIGSPCGSLARRARYGVSKFHSPECVGAGACYRPGGSRSTMPHSARVHPASGAFWFKPVSLFGLLLVTAFIADSDAFAIPTI